MNQQKINSKREVRTEARPAPGEIYGRRWTWIEVTPDNLAGQFEVVPEGGSTEPDNIPQMRQDAQLLVQLFGQNPSIDQRQLQVKALELFGFKNAETMLTPPQPTVDPNVVGQLLTEAGMDPEQVNQILQAGQVAHEQAQETGEPQDAQAIMAEIQGQTGGTPSENGAQAQQAEPVPPGG